MQQIIFFVIFIIVFSVAAFAQNENFDPYQYGKVSSFEEKVYLDTFFVSLQQNKTYEGVIILRFDKKDSINKRIKRVRSIIKWVKFRKVELNRIIFMISEVDDEHITLLPLPKNSRLLEDLSKDYKPIKAEEFEQKINVLFSKK